MRKNLPVTTTEYPVTDETLIVSQTDTGSASEQVLSAAKSRSSESNRLKLEVGKFLQSVGAA